MIREVEMASFEARHIEERAHQLRERLDRVPKAAQAACVEATRCHMLSTSEHRPPIRMARRNCTRSVLLLLRRWTAPREFIDLGHSGAKASRPVLGELAPRMRRSSCKFPALRRSLTALTLALAGACNRCDAPAQTKYSCNSIDPTADGCVGDPALGADAGANPTTYPLGCMAELPYCSPYYPDRHGQPCKCDDLHVLDAGPQWVCPM